MTAESLVSITVIVHDLKKPGKYVFSISLQFIFLKNYDGFSDSRGDVNFFPGNSKQSI
jgi:hypothetical protein